MQIPFDIAADLDTPVSAYLKLAQFDPCFLLESVVGGERLGRYSFIGLGVAFSVSLDADGLRLGDQMRPRPQGRQELLDALREARTLAPKLHPAPPELPFCGGLVGVAGYDSVRFFEKLPTLARHEDGLPQMYYVAPRSMLVFDHASRRAALLHSGSEIERRALRNSLVAALRGPVPVSDEAATVAEATASMTRDEYLQAVEAAQEQIAAGEVYQLVLSVAFEGRTDVDPFQVYRALRLLNPSPYMYFLNLDGRQIVGSSPEALVQLKEGVASLRPIAGTRPRDDDSERDRELAEELLADPKENAEHVMLVDLARNDLGRVALPGTVRVEPFRIIERYSHVMHIVSGVCGELASTYDAFDLFAAAFPAGTLVGAPKVRAMELIEAAEPVGRGWYAGTVGYFGHDGGGNLAMDQAIAIRTLVFSAGHYRYQAGAGVVADSVPEAEYNEVLAKSQILRKALAIAEQGL